MFFYPKLKLWTPVIMLSKAKALDSKILFFIQSFSFGAFVPQN
ncbi:hypothetical protein BGP_5190 [Beggiatoa sp. PS]|nr:hypothetical protein BGP_5190 [Beggiatoa sp. PS]